MAGKKGTVLGRLLTSLIPANSVFHDVAEAADQTIEAVMFDDGSHDTTEVKNHTVVGAAVETIANMLLALAASGNASINYPFLDGTNEENAKKAAYGLLEAYVNQTEEEVEALLSPTA